LSKPPNKSATGVKSLHSKQSGDFGRNCFLSLESNRVLASKGLQATMFATSLVSNGVILPALLSQGEI